MWKFELIHWHKENVKLENSTSFQFKYKILGSTPEASNADT